MNTITPETIVGDIVRTAPARSRIFENLGIEDCGGGKKPLVYSCSGASSAAQMANHIAVKLDRLRLAEMSCIAGVGGDVEPLVRTAKSGRPIIAIDGCPLHCAAQILKRHGLRADKHYDLSALAIKKRKHEDFDPQEAARVIQHILVDLGCPGPTARTSGQLPLG